MEVTENLVKRFILGRGQVFSEETCLAKIYSKDKEIEAVSIYNVTCSSLEGEILYAKVDDVHKLLKLEENIVQFLV